MMPTVAIPVIQAMMLLTPKNLEYMKIAVLEQSALCKLQHGRCKCLVVVEPLTPCLSKTEKQTDPIPKTL